MGSNYITFSNQQSKIDIKSTKNCLVSLSKYHLKYKSTCEVKDKNITGMPTKVFVSHVRFLIETIKNKT